MISVKKTALMGARIIFGALFIFSGFVKAVDPLGSLYKFNDYFLAFGTEWASSLSFFLAFALSALEFTVGVAILLNLKPNWATRGGFAFMSIFLPLTLYIAIANPVSDCGCFGDALVITNWQTFGKNVVLFLLAWFLMRNRKDLGNVLGCYEQWVVVALSVCFILGISRYSYKHLPVLDFRPYAVGTYIPDGMAVPEGAPQDEWESVFIYAKDGEEQEFLLDALPDSTWTFVDAQHKLVRKGYEPPIHDFSLLSLDGTDITDVLLHSANYNFLLVSYDLEKADKKNVEKINRLAEFAYSQGYPFYATTASSNEAVDEFLNETQGAYEFYNTDETTLKTVVRSNPGIVVLKEGTIVEKWHANDIPDVKDLSPAILHQSLEKYTSKANTYYIWVLLLGMAFLLTLYLWVRKTIQKH